MSKSRILLAVVSVVASAWASTAQAAPQGFYDAEARRQAMRDGQLPQARQACLGEPRDPSWASMTPITMLATTAEYGTDRTAQPFAWALMVLAGRALADDVDSRVDLRSILSRWAEADAFGETEVAHDAYYALKRVLLPIIVAHAVVRADMKPRDRDAVERWIDGLVRRIDKKFDGDVDRNNHRTLADSVLATWGTLSGDRGLYEQGLKGFAGALDQARNDGSLPLESRRGARAAWYARQTLASLTLIAEAARVHGLDLYDASGDPRAAAFRLALGHLANIVAEPDLALAYSAENYIPGPQEDFTKPDLGFLEPRSNGRSYMSFLFALKVREPDSIALRRLSRKVPASPEAASIDEFIGGNASCFWGES